jgi:hypothetical protein
MLLTRVKVNTTDATTGATVMLQPAQNTIVHLTRPHRNGACALALPLAALRMRMLSPSILIAIL